MDERSWELYRRSVVSEMPDCPLKQALVHAIEHKLEILVRSSSGDQPAVGIPAQNRR